MLFFSLDLLHKYETVQEATVVTITEAVPTATATVQVESLKEVMQKAAVALPISEPIVEEAAFEVETYTIKAGDTLSEIANQFYGDPSMASFLAEANSITNPNLIYTGKKLYVPLI